MERRLTVKLSLVDIRDIARAEKTTIGTSLLSACGCLGERPDLAKSGSWISALRNGSLW